MPVVKTTYLYMFFTHHICNFFCKWKETLNGTRESLSCISIESDFYYNPQ